MGRHRPCTHAVPAEGTGSPPTTGDQEREGVSSCCKGQLQGPHSGSPRAAPIQNRRSHSDHTPQGLTPGQHTSQGLSLPRATGARHHPALPLHCPLRVALQAIGVICPHALAHTHPRLCQPCASRELLRAPHRVPCRLQCVRALALPPRLPSQTACRPRPRQHAGPSVRGASVSSTPKPGSLTRFLGSIFKSAFPGKPVPAPCRVRPLSPAPPALTTGQYCLVMVCLTASQRLHPDFLAVPLPQPPELV